MCQIKHELFTKKADVGVPRFQAFYKRTVMKFNDEAWGNGNRTGKAIGVSNAWNFPRERELERQFALTISLLTLVTLGY